MYVLCSLRNHFVMYCTLLWFILRALQLWITSCSQHYLKTEFSTALCEVLPFWCTKWFVISFLFLVIDLDLVSFFGPMPLSCL